MKVILLERIARLGAIGDEVTVKDGFARNFLLPSGKALRANAANREQFETQRGDIVARNEERKGIAAEISQGLDGQTFMIVRSAGETGQLYGSVTSRDISDLLAAAGHKVARNQVDLKTPIKTIGFTNVVLTLHPEVQTSITLNIARTAEEAARQAEGEDLSSADAIYGENDDKFESLADFEDEDERPRRKRNSGNSAPAAEAASE
ncbi:MAG: 50S ribosomal protein L9 [Ahrensia sp.]|nr:50S ribosomal protein L9 [Ahrensia sp.]